MIKVEPAINFQDSPTIDSLAKSYRAIRIQSEKLAESLSDEDCSAQSMSLASPTKWHLAHTSWFFETFILAPGVSAYTHFNDAFAVLFNSYYNGIGEQYKRANRGMLTRPGLTNILAYRKHIDQAMEKLLNADTIDNSTLELVELGLNHEQQHQELILTDIKHLLSFNPLYPVYRQRWPLSAVHPTDLQWIDMKAGLVLVGHSDKSFCFDNERPAHDVFVADFKIANRPVTNREYIEFIDDGGYERAELWLDNGWYSKQNNAWFAPKYWRNEDGKWRCFTLHGDCAVDPDAPVCHISFYEAEAFARWAEARLPTEQEWEVVAKQVPVQGNFLDSDVFHPLALTDLPEANSPAQLFGDVWEWTRSDYAPYPGYRQPAGTVGEYNGKFMSGQYVLRGGSCVTPAGHIRSSYRNFFPANARWQFSGIRLARDVTS